MRIRDWSSDVCSSDLLDRADVADWQRRLYAKGWVAPNWPKAFGGTGWTAIQKYIFDVECGVANAPEISLIALSMVGPVLCRFVSPALPQRVLDPIMRGDLLFCQGFSEQQSGSSDGRRVGKECVLPGGSRW